MKPRVLLLAAVLWGQEAVPAELLENLDFFMAIEVDEASAEEGFFDLIFSTAPEAENLLLEEEPAEEAPRPEPGEKPAGKDGKAKGDEPEPQPRDKGDQRRDEEEKP